LLEALCSQLLFAEARAPNYRSSEVSNFDHCKIGTRGPHRCYPRAPNPPKGFIGKYFLTHFRGSPDPWEGAPNSHPHHPPPQPRPQRRPRRSARVTGGRSAAGGGVGIAIYSPTLQPLLSHKQPVISLRVSISIYQSICFTMRFCRKISRNLCHRG